MKRSVALGVLVGLTCPLALAAQAAPAADSLAKAASAAATANTVAINFVWTLVAGFLVMFMQAGFAMVETGFTRAKNAAHTMTMNFMVYGIAMLAYWRSEEHTSELQSRSDLVCRLLLEKKKTSAEISLIFFIVIITSRPPTDWDQ